MVTNRRIIDHRRVKRDGSLMTVVALPSPKMLSFLSTVMLQGYTPALKVMLALLGTLEIASATTSVQFLL
jgi:hypothetical protein